MLAQVEHIELYCKPELIPFYEHWGFSTTPVDVNLMRRVGPPDRLRQGYGESAEASCEGGRRTPRGSYSRAVDVPDGTRCSIQPLITSNT